MPGTLDDGRPFSGGWMAFSIFVFCAVEIFIGGFLGDIIHGTYRSMALDYKVQMLLILVSYFLGGVVVGVFSPGVRILEPAVGAFFSVLLVFLMRFFVPHFWFRHTSFTQLAIGGIIAAVLAYYGAKLGEKVTGNIDEV